ncbi:MAG: hypothetical protein C0478_08915 [Planctomyces sp.]|nr:hypothetical protein [Planctomyces sp.]
MALALGVVTESTQVVPVRIPDVQVATVPIPVSHVPRDAMVRVTAPIWAEHVLPEGMAHELREHREQIVTVHPSVLAPALIVGPVLTIDQVRRHPMSLLQA